MSISKPELTMESQLKIRTSFFGIWKTVHVELRGTHLTIKKNPTSPEIEKSIEITQTSQVKQLEGANGAKFSIQNGEEQPNLFMASSPDDAFQWVNILRSAAFPVDSLSPDRFTVVSVIGRGYYGKVMLVRDLVSGELCAVKTIHKTRLIKARKVETVITERNILLTAKHPFIVGLRFAFQTDAKFYLGMEFAPGGELFRLMTNKSVIELEDIRIYAAEIALGLNYLHSIGIVYRDLKPENVLLSSKGHVKLTDFGLAKDISGEFSTSTFCGTTEYIAPEVVQRKPYSFQVDWWSLGVLIYEMAMGRTPFFDSSRVNMYEKILSAPPAFPDDEDQDLVNIVESLLDKNPETRLGFEGIKKHPFLNSIDFDQILNGKIIPSYVPESLKVTENFDSEFTAELPVDSIIHAPDGNNENFNGFSFPGFPIPAPVHESPLIDRNLIHPSEFEGIN